MRLFASLLAVAGVANAQTTAMNELPIPAMTGYSQQCSATAFDGADIVGTCITHTAQACSGRGCQPVRFTTAYITHWDASLTPTTEPCYVVRTHLPQAPQYTYYGGHTAADCPFVLNNTGVSVQINGSSWWYVTADSTREIVNDNYTSYLVTF